MIHCNIGFGRHLLAIFRTKNADQTLFEGIAISKFTQILKKLSYTITSGSLTKMSFLDKLKMQKNKLKETNTIITQVDGQRYLENKQETVSLDPSTHGYVVDTKPDNIPILIDDFIYIGSQDCTNDAVLEKYNIKHVLSLGIDIQTTVNHKFISVLDLPESNITHVLKEALPFIKKGVDSKENVLVHCNAGVSRTSMVAIAYLMQYRMMKYDDAFKLVKSRRPAIRPNDGFQKQLLSMIPGKLIN